MTNTDKKWIDALTDGAMKFAILWRNAAIALIVLWIIFALSGCAAWRHPKYPLTPVGGVVCKTGALKPFGGPGWHSCVEKKP